MTRNEAAQLLGLDSRFYFERYGGSDGPGDFRVYWRGSGNQKIHVCSFVANGQEILSVESCASRRDGIRPFSLSMDGVQAAFLDGLMDLLIEYTTRAELLRELIGRVQNLPAQEEIVRQG